MRKTLSKYGGAVAALGLLAACSSVPSASPSPEVRLKAFRQAVEKFSDRFAASQAVDDFARQFGRHPTVEIARSRGLSLDEERLLRHRLIRALLSHADRLTLVIGPGRSRLSASRERSYLMRHGSMSEPLPLPGHVKPATFVIFSSAGRDLRGDPRVWLTAIRLDNNQIVAEQEVPVPSASGSSESRARARTPHLQHVTFRVVSDLSRPVAVWLDPPFPTDGPDSSGTGPAGVPPVATIRPGESRIVGVFKGFRRGNVFLCLQGVLYRNLCRKYYVPYDDGVGTPFEITGTDPYGFVRTRILSER
jgi:hypothetical protein